MLLFAAAALALSATFLRKASSSDNCCLRTSIKTKTRSRGSSTAVERGDLLM